MNSKQIKYQVNVNQKYIGQPQSGSEVAERWEIIKYADTDCTISILQNVVIDIEFLREQDGGNHCNGSKYDKSNVKQHAKSLWRYSDHRFCVVSIDDRFAFLNGRQNQLHSLTTGEISGYELSFCIDGL